MNDDRPIFLIDCANLFLRAYSVYPSMSSMGHQTGGIVGFLKTLKRLVTEFRPRQVYCVWESGGSTRRRALFSEYKQNRKPAKLNRFYEDDIPDTDENRISQVRTLAKLLKMLPVCQVYVADCEGDDVIAYLVRHKFRDDRKIIVSSDRDFYQLLDERTSVYNLHKKTIVTGEHVLEQFRISARNFALAKALCGDASDNIPGVKGLGFKTLAKRLPIFGTEVELTIGDVENFCQTHLSPKVKIYGEVLQNMELVRRNWKLIYLDSSMLSANQVSRIDYVISTFTPAHNKIGFIKSLIEEGISDFDVDGLFLAMVGIFSY